MSKKKFQNTPISQPQKGVELVDKGGKISKPRQPPHGTVIVGGGVAVHNPITDGVQVVSRVDKEVARGNE